VCDKQDAKFEDPKTSNFGPRTIALRASLAPRSLLLLLLGARQCQRHGHRTGWLWLAIRSMLGR
jgi:hypothetical protein